MSRRLRPDEMAQPADDLTVWDEAQPPDHCSLCGRVNAKYRVTAGHDRDTGALRYEMRERCVTHEWPFWRRWFIGWHPWREGWARVQGW